MDLEYDTFGSRDDPALLLVMGFTAQMTQWPDDFCRRLADGGLHVIRFDNRDCGLSTKLDGVQVDTGPVIAAALSGQAVPPVPYTLSDMAADAIGLLDALGVERAHILGASMGGMIVQTMAIEHPQRVISLISVMSMTGEPGVGQATPESAAALLAPPPLDRQGYIDSAPSWMIWHSKKYRNEARARQQAADSYDRMFYPEGASRQLAAIYASGSRVAGLSALNVPTLVIHGRDDTLITPSGGLRTAELIDGANLLLVADMGHDMPEELWPVLVDAITSHARHAQHSRQAQHATT
jgi:pimeloyl-ACP methyl ester carboxylesterase